MSRHFQRGSGCFTCDVCGRKTRMTTQAICSKLCGDCYELAGIYNVFQDGGDVTEYASAIRAHTANITAHGGTLDEAAAKLLELIGGNTSTPTED
jgi:hypothetical protein